MSRAALYHAAVDSFKDIFDTTTTVNHHAETLMVDGMRKIVPRDATDSQFEAVRALVNQAVIDNGFPDSLTPLPFETALEAKSEDEARVMVKLKYLTHLERNARPRGDDDLPIIHSHMPSFPQHHNEFPVSNRAPIPQRSCPLARVRLDTDGPENGD